MTEHELAKQIQEKSFLPVYLLYGEEDFLIERCAKDLAAAALGDGDPSFNQDIFRGTEHAAEDVTAAANAFPFMSEKRVVTVRECDPLLKTTALANYVENPSPDTVLILCAGTLKPSRAKKRPARGGKVNMLSLVQQLERGKDSIAAAVEFKALRDQGALRWITEEFRSAGKTISPEATTVMHALRGNSTRVLASEIDKLLSAVPDRDRIETDDVYRHLGASKQYNVFELANAVMARDGAKAQEILAHLLGSEEPVMIVATLARQFALLWRVRVMEFHGRATDEQARELGLIWGWQVETFRPFVKNFSDPEYFERCFEYILDTDTALKSQASDPAAMVTRLVSELTRA